ncbi:aldo/keto reductase [Pseudogracilibacillus sp. SE30717A]|uniref:aldo/keto reductase n=1 Tax=Pseudogracilibacillus sp. SE30717A TaxID=3098293 RepID=UPI00300E2320
MKYERLNNNVLMPQLGLGVYKVLNEEVTDVVTHALNVGYRSIDTAQFYENEDGVGEAIRNSPIPREDLFITSKVWNSHHGYDNTLRAFEESMEKLKLEYLDLYLIHWPTPMYDQYIETYKALEKLYHDGRVKAIGVSNFNIEHLERVLNECDVTPVLNQVEYHPYLQQDELKKYCREHSILIEAWSPLARGNVLNDPAIVHLAKKHQKSPAQIVLRWHIQQDSIIIPKSVTPSRIRENFHIFDFELSSEDMKKIEKLNRNERTGRDPNEMNVR